ncbi:MAG: putative tail fiber protein [Caudoviricetes sp.]|nr:MAG: putative tail fiber protein [Caudoviricetes sp.]
MKSTDDHSIFTTLIGSSASSGDIATIPATQATAGDGTASLALAFPPETFIAQAAGGKPPRGADMNGFLRLLSHAVQALQAGYVGQYNSTLAQSIGGYPSGAIVSGSAVGTFWISTADNNVTVPGATGATWKSLFDGYATQDWANSWFVKNLGGTKGIIGATIDSTTGQPTFQDGSENWHQMQVYGQCPKFSDFVSGWGQNGYVEIPTSGNWKLVVQWVQFQGVTGTGGNNGAGRYETADIFVTWPLGMGNLLSIPGLAVEDVGGVGMQEQVWKMADPTATSGSFRLACNASGTTMTGSAWIVGSVTA